MDQTRSTDYHIGTTIVYSAVGRLIRLSRSPTVCDIMTPKRTKALTAFATLALFDVLDCFKPALLAIGSLSQSCSYNE